MPYKDPEVARIKALERKHRYRKRLHEAKYGPGAGDQRGRHQPNRLKREQHWWWTGGRTVNKGGYISVYLGVGHHLADRRGYVLEHRLVWANAGNPLPKDDEVIHHKNGNKQDNRIENLELMKRVDHSVHHNHQALTYLQVRMVRELYDRGEADMMQLAERFKATISRICRIIRGETRASVGGPINRNNKSRRYQKKREWSQVPEELQR